jgi:GxxExxY protein
MTILLHKNVTDQIIAAFYTVYNALGFGFLESVYRKALIVELRRRGVAVREEVPGQVHYLGICVGTFRFDLLVGEVVLVEIKAAEQTTRADEQQLLNYLRVSDVEVGLLLHFGPEAKFHRFAYANARKSHHSVL